MAWEKTAGVGQSMDARPPILAGPDFGMMAAAAPETMAAVLAMIAWVQRRHPHASRSSRQPREADD